MEAGEFVGGIYAIAYGFIIAYHNAKGIPTQFPTDDAALTFALIVGGLYIVYPKLRSYLKLLQQII